MHTLRPTHAYINEDDFYSIMNLIGETNNDRSRV